MDRRRGGIALASVVALLAACGGSDTGGALGSGEPATKAERSSETPTTDETLDRSPFCIAVRGLEALGAAPATGDRTPAAVLEQNDQLAGLIEDAASNAPQDAPAAVAALIEDYRAITSAVQAGAGDAQAAMTAMSTESPELMARLGDTAAHREAFSFFADRCGTTAPS